MKPLPPKIIGPISECNKTVRVKAVNTGASVTVLVNGNPAGSQIAGIPEVYVGIEVQLAAGDLVTATQEFEGEVSPVSPDHIIVQAPPDTLSGLTILTHLRKCSHGLWAQGAAPGAEVKAMINGVEVGSAISIDGNVRLRYTPALNVGFSLDLVQTACNNATSTTTSQDAEGLPEGVGGLPTPIIQPPLIECQTTISISNILDGATVTLYRNGQQEISDIFDLPSLTWFGLSPFVLNDTIEVEQAFFCKPESPTPSHKTLERASSSVESIDKLHAPVIVGKICAALQVVNITNLIPGAQVIIYQDNVELGINGVLGSTFDFPVTGLISGAMITARMRLCGMDGPLSEAVVVGNAGVTESVSAATLYPCASYISASISSSEQGPLKVYAKNKDGNMISDVLPASAAFNTLIPISPALVITDKVTISVVSCDGTPKDFGPFLVEELPSLDPPVIQEPIIVNSIYVNVDSKIAGAIISVYRSHDFAGQAISLGNISLTPVLLAFELHIGDSVQAKQTFCGSESKYSESVRLVNPPPMQPKLIFPGSHQTNVNTQEPFFVWSDPGHNTSAAAAYFTFELWKGNNKIHDNDITEITSYNPDFNMDYETEYQWKITSVNATGTNSNNRYFITEDADAPPPPEEEEAHLQFGSHLFAAQLNDCGTALEFLHANEPFKISINVTNVGNALSTPFTVQFLGQLNNVTVFGQVDEPYEALNPGQSIWACTQVPSMAAEHYIFYVGISVEGQLIQNTWAGMWVGQFD